MRRIKLPSSKMHGQFYRLELKRAAPVVVRVDEHTNHDQSLAIWTAHGWLPVARFHWTINWKQAGTLLRSILNAQASDR